MFGAANAFERHKKAATGRYANFATKGSSGLVKGLGRMAFNPVGGTFLLGGMASAMSYDSTKDSVTSYAAKEALKLSGDAAMEATLFGLLPKTLGGAALGIGFSVAAYGLGFNPGALIGSALDSAGESYRKDRGISSTPIKQNERTMKSMQQAMRLVGRSTGHSMLGSEAQYMHN